MYLRRYGSQVETFHSKVLSEYRLLPFLQSSEQSEDFRVAKYFPAVTLKN